MFGFLVGDEDKAAEDAGALLLPAQPDSDMLAVAARLIIAAIFFLYNLGLLLDLDMGRTPFVCDGNRDRNLVIEDLRRRPC
jgi:hypothetical protein